MHRRDRISRRKRRRRVCSSVLGGCAISVRAVVLLLVLGGWSGQGCCRRGRGCSARQGRPAGGRDAGQILGARDAGGQRRCFCFLAAAAEAGAACWGGRDARTRCGAGRPAGARAGGPGGAGARRCRGVRGLGDDAPGVRNGPQRHGSRKAGATATASVPGCAGGGRAGARGKARAGYEGR
jgi:hypothetical protein